MFNCFFFVHSEPTCRTYSKRQACLYCVDLFAKAARHLKAMHGEETEVKHAVAKESTTGNKRSLDFEKLRLQGNFYHNMQVMSTGEGEPIVVRDPSHDHDLQSQSKDYLPCPFCLGLYLQYDLWRHKQKCFVKLPPIPIIKRSHTTR